MQLRIPLDFVKAYAPLTWHEAEYGLENGWLTNDDIVALAIDRASAEQHSSPSVIELASVLPHEKHRISEIIDRLAQEDPELSKSKWLFLLLAWLYERRGKVEDPLGIVEELYADFDYPKEIEGFVRYMPAEQPQRTGEPSLLDAWQRYLEAGAHTYRPTGYRV